MTFSFEKASSDIFNSASSQIRLQVLKLLDTKGAMPYTEIMFSLKLDPVRDAGKFVYHLKNLMEPGLITLDKEKKRYSITELGRLIVKFARELGEYVAVKGGNLFVRTSRFSIEEFNKEKIVNSLVNEAKIPYDQAQDIATEAEDRLIQLNTAYLTAPLIREFINAILIEKGLEEYRHKLTRLGMPVYDVSQLFKRTGEKLLNVENIFYESGSSVLEEYALLASLPRDIADAHLSGSIHISNLDFWSLKPREIQHDVRFFFRDGFLGPRDPKTFEAALESIKIAYHIAKTEVSGEQGIDMFNVFLAPFVRGNDIERIREALLIFFSGLHQDQLLSLGQQGMSLSLEFGVPSFFKKIKAIGPSGKVAGVYGDYEDETTLLLDIILEVFAETSSIKPFFNPRLILKLRDGVIKEKKFEKQLLKAHDLASKSRVPYFAYLGDEEKTSYTASGLRLSDDWTNDRDTDCVRTGNMAAISINLPRIIYESNGKEEEIFNSLETIMSVCKKAFIEKRKIMKKRVKQGLLPFLFGSKPSDQYFLQNRATYAFSFVGLNEAVAAHTGSNIYKEDGLKFGLELIQKMAEIIKKYSEESVQRFVIAQNPEDDASTRLAELDLEKYGVANAKISGSRGYPYYTDVPIVPLTIRTPLNRRFEIEGNFQGMLTGGHLGLFCLKHKKHSARSLYRLTKRIMGNGVKFFTYAASYTYCKRCNRSFEKNLLKCPNCKSNLLEYFGRSSSILKPLSLWRKAKRKAMDKWIHFSP